MQKIPFYIVDVFAEKPYQGNQLAVFDVTNQTLTHDQMLKLAQEIDFQESTFIFNKNEADNQYEVKIYTPEFEMVFAGHPTIGTSWVLMNKLIAQKPHKITLNLKVGAINVSKIDDVLWVTAAQPTFIADYSMADICSFTNLEISDFRSDFPIQEVSTGSPFIIVPLNSIEALSQLTIQVDKLKQWYKNQGWEGRFKAFYFYMEKEYITARMLFVERSQLKEDAATGSAASCLLAYLLEHQQKNIHTVIHQGEFMNRPSKIYLNGKKASDYLIQIGGNTQFIAQGEWAFPS